MIMPFGKHKGKQLDALGTSYLTWLVRNLTDRPDICAEAARVLGERNGGPILDPATERLVLDLRTTIDSLEASVNELRAELMIERSRKPAPISVADFDTWYKRAVKLCHPDRGGDLAIMQLLNELKDRIRR
jgi:Putative quorum-sensing-regulated virulence factor